PSRLLKKWMTTALLFSTRLGAGPRAQRCDALHPLWPSKPGGDEPALRVPRRPTDAHTVWAVRFRIRTRLYAARAKVNIQSTRRVPRYRVLRISPMVLSQPKISSTRFRRRWLTA